MKLMGKGSRSKGGNMYEFALTEQQRDFREADALLEQVAKVKAELKK